MKFHWIPTVSLIMCMFEMFKKIENPAAWEVRSVTRFLHPRNMRPCEIYRQINEVYGDMTDESSDPDGVAI